jgi:predicted transposase YbfD/YdcC
MLITFLQDVKDFRRPQARKYELHAVLLFSILALLCNAKSYRDIHRFMKVHIKALKKDFSLSWKQVPGYTTIRNIIRGVDKEALEVAFRAYTQSLGNYNNQSGESYTQIAIDGKVLRGSFDHFNDKKALQQLMFFDVNQKLILGHVSIEEKTNEIPVMQSLLKELELSGVIYTADALHCQKKLLNLVVKTMHCLFRSKTIKNACWRIYNCLALKARLTIHTRTSRKQDTDVSLHALFRYIIKTWVILLWMKIGQSISKRLPKYTGNIRYLIRKPNVTNNVTKRLGIYLTEHFLPNSLPILQWGIGA